MTTRVRRTVAWTLFAAGFFALVMHGEPFERMDAWAWASMLALIAAAVVAFPDRAGWRWGLASVPLWIYSNGMPWIQYAAVAMTVAAMAAAAVGPTLVGRRVRHRGLSPLPHLAAGPLTVVTPRLYGGGQPSRLLGYVALGLAVLAVVLCGAAAFAGGGNEALGLGIAAAIIAATLTFANWFAGRVHVRVDGAGVHGRTLFREHTVRWNEVAELQLRYLFLPSSGTRLVYYVVRSPRTEVSFPSTMIAAGDLQAAIEAATGLRWPAPTITPTM